MNPKVPPFDSNNPRPEGIAVDKSFPPGPEDDELLEDAEAENVHSTAVDSEATLGNSLDDKDSEEQEDVSKGFFVAARVPEVSDSESTPDKSFPHAAAPSSPPKAPTKFKGGFADEDDLISDEEEEFPEPPPAKKPRTESTKSVNSTPEEVKAKASSTSADAVPASDASRRMLTKTLPPLSAAAATPSGSHPIVATVRQVHELATQFINLEAENAHLRQEVVKEVQTANERAEHAQKENEDLKKELARTNLELRQAKNELLEAKKIEEQRKEKDSAAAIACRHLLKSVEGLLASADMPLDRTRPHDVAATDDPILFATSAATRVEVVMSKAKNALTTIFGLVFPKLPQGRLVEEMADALLTEAGDKIEILKRSSRLLGALLAFQILMGSGLAINFEELLFDVPKNEDGTEIVLTQYTSRACKCARQLLHLADLSKSKGAEKGIPSASARTSMPAP